MEEEFRALLTGSAAVTALVPAARIGWGSVPQGTAYPLIVLTTISQFDTGHMQGQDMLLQARVQADCYATSMAGAKAVARAVILRLHMHRGGGFRLITWANGGDSREAGTNEADRPYRSRLEFTLRWRDTNG